MYARRNLSNMFTVMFESKRFFLIVKMSNNYIISMNKYSLIQKAPFYTPRKFGNTKNHSICAKNFHPFAIYCYITLTDKNEI